MRSCSWTLHFLDQALNLDLKSETPLSKSQKTLSVEIWKSISDDPDVYFQAVTCNSASMQGTLKVGNFRGGGNFCKFQGFKAPNLSSDSPQGQFVDQRRPSGGGGGGGYCAWRTIRLPVSVERYNYVSVKMGGEAGTFGEVSPCPPLTWLNSAEFSFQQLPVFHPPWFNLQTCSPRQKLSILSRVLSTSVQCVAAVSSN